MGTLLPAASVEGSRRLNGSTLKSLEEKVPLMVEWWIGVIGHQRSQSAYHSASMSVYIYTCTRTSQDHVCPIPIRRVLEGKLPDRHVREHLIPIRTTEGEGVANVDGAVDGRHAKEVDVLVPLDVVPDGVCVMRGGTYTHPHNKRSLEAKIKSTHRRSRGLPRLTLALNIQEPSSSPASSSVNSYAYADHAAPT